MKFELKQFQYIINLSEFKISEFSQHMKFIKVIYSLIPLIVSVLFLFNIKKYFQIFTIYIYFYLISNMMDQEPVEANSLNNDPYSNRGLVMNEVIDGGKRGLQTDLHTDSDSYWAKDNLTEARGEVGLPDHQRSMKHSRMATAQANLSMPQPSAPDIQSSASVTVKYAKNAPHNIHLHSQLLNQSVKDLQEIQKSGFVQNFERVTLEDSMASAGDVSAVINGSIQPSVALPEQIMQMHTKQSKHSLNFQVEELKAQEVSTDSENDQKDGNQFEIQNGDNSVNEHLPSIHSKSSRLEQKIDNMSALQLLNQQSGEIETLNRLDEAKMNQQELKQISEKEVDAQKVQIAPTHEILINGLKTDDKAYELFAWGLNDNHQLGQLGGPQSSTPTSKGLQDGITPGAGSFPSGCSSSKAILIPRQVKDLENVQVRQIACGSSHSMILTTDGDVYALGNNSHGELGFLVQRHPLLSQPVKVSIQANPKVKQVACSSSHSLLLTEDGEVLGAGLNESGQVGLGLVRRIVVEEFQRISVPTSGCVEKIWCNDGVSGAAIKANDGSLEIWVWGRFEGQNQMDECAPRMVSIPSEILNKGGIKDIKSSLNALAILTGNGQVYQYQSSLSKFSHIQQLSNVIEIASHGKYFAALDAKNQIHHWNDEQAESLQLLQSSLSTFQQQVDTKLRDLSIGLDFGHVIDQDDNLHGWGNNKNGELGSGDSYPRVKLSQIRIFNSQKSYMRCKEVFHGNNFAFGLFESVKCAKKRVQSPAAAGALEAYADATQSAKERSQPPTESASMVDISASFGAEKARILSAAKPNDVQKNQFDLQMPNCSRFAAPRSASREVVASHYNATEKALDKYRKHSQNYRENMVKIQALEHYNENHHIEQHQELGHGGRASLRPAARSTSAHVNYVAEGNSERHQAIPNSNFKNTISSLLNETQKQSQYSPGKQVAKSFVPPEHQVSQAAPAQQTGQRMRELVHHTYQQKHHDSTLAGRGTIQLDGIAKWRNARQTEDEASTPYLKQANLNSLDANATKKSTMLSQKAEELGGNAYSFSDLQHQFDENKEELRPFREQSMKFTSKFAGSLEKRKGLTSNHFMATNESNDLSKRRRDWSHDHALARHNRVTHDPPTVTSLDLQDSQHVGKQHHIPLKEQNVGGKKLRDGNLSKIIENSISATSSMLQLSKHNGRSHSYQREPQRHQPLQQYQALRSKERNRPLSHERSEYNEIKMLTEEANINSDSARDNYNLSLGFSRNQNAMRPCSLQDAANATGEAMRNRFADQSRAIPETAGETSRGGPTPGDSTMTLLKSTERPSQMTEFHDSSLTHLQVNVGVTEQTQQQINTIHEVTTPSIEAEQRGRRSPYQNGSSQFAYGFENQAAQHPQIRDLSLSQHDGSLPRTTTDNAAASLRPFGQDGNPRRQFEDSKYIAQIKKLNKYKRKLKKYMTTNQSLQHQVTRLNDLNTHLSTQNDRLMRYGKQSNGIGEALQIQIRDLEEQMAAMRHDYEAKLNESTHQINMLTQENLKMLGDIGDRDENHKQLEEKLEYVDQEIQKLGSQLKEQNDINQKLKKEVEKYKTKAEKRGDVEQSKRQEVKTLKNQLYELKRELQKKNDEILKKDSEIIELQRYKIESKNETKELMKDYKEVQFQAKNLQGQNLDILRQLQEKTNILSQYDMSYQIQSGKTTKITTGISQRSMTRNGQMGPLQVNFPSLDNPRMSRETNELRDKKQMMQQHQGPKKIAESSETNLPFQPSLQKFDQSFDRELDQSKNRQEILGMTSSQLHTISPGPHQLLEAFSHQQTFHNKHNANIEEMARQSLSHQQMHGNQSQPHLQNTGAGDSSMTQPTIQTQMHSPIHQYACYNINQMQKEANITNGNYHFAEQPTQSDHFQRPGHELQAFASGHQGRQPIQDSVDGPQFGLNMSNLNQSSIYCPDDQQTMDAQVSGHGQPVLQAPAHAQKYQHKHGARSLSGPPDLRDQRYLQTYQPGASVPPYAVFHPPSQHSFDSNAPLGNLQVNRQAPQNLWAQSSYPNYAYIQQMYFNVKRQQRVEALQHDPMRQGVASPTLATETHQLGTAQTLNDQLGSQLNGQSVVKSVAPTTTGLGDGRMGPTPSSMPQYSHQQYSNASGKSAGREFTSNKATPAQIHISNFNARMPPRDQLSQREVPRADNNQPSPDRNKQRLTFSELSADEQQKLIECMKDNSRSISRGDRSSRAAASKPQPVLQTAYQAHTFQQWKQDHKPTSASNENTRKEISAPGFTGRAPQAPHSERPLSPQPILQRPDLDKRDELPLIPREAGRPPRQQASVVTMRDLDDQGPKSAVAKASSQKHDSASKERTPEPPLNYRDAILNKFSKRTNDRILQLMQQEVAGGDDDEGEKKEEEEPIEEADRSAKDENQTAEQSSTSNTKKEEIPCRGLQQGVDGRPSLERIAENLGGPQLRKAYGNHGGVENQEAREVQAYRERSKEWYQRRGRALDAEKAPVAHGDISQTYKDAFRNLSMELKKRIQDVKKGNDSKAPNFRDARNQNLTGTDHSSVSDQRKPRALQHASSASKADADDYLSAKYLRPSNPATEKAGDQNHQSNATIQVNRFDSMRTLNAVTANKSPEYSASESKPYFNGRANQQQRSYNRQGQ